MIPSGKAPALINPADYPIFGSRSAIRRRRTVFIDLSQCATSPFPTSSSVNGEWSLIMTKLALCLGLAGTMLSSAVHAQVTIDMSRVTCAEYLALPPAQSANFSAWMSGWFNQKNGYVFVDLTAYARNVANVKSWCASNPAETVMAGLQRATAR
jgi:hypothetical protein